MNSQSFENARRAHTIGCVIIALCAANLLRPFYAPDHAYPAFDFIHFWRAGVMWFEGASPYDPAYAEAVLGGDYLVRPFFYPPAARVLFEPLALMPLGTARLAYTGLAVAMWGAAAWLTARGTDVRLRFIWRLVLLAALMSVGMTQLRLSTEGGQTTVLTVFALAALVASLRAEGRARGLLLGVGAFLLMMKPQLGLPVCLLIALRGAPLRPLVLAGVAYAAATLYGCGGRPDLIIPAFLANAGAYATFLENGPLFASGLGSLGHRVGVSWPGGVALAGAVAVFACLLGRARRLQTDTALLCVVTASLLVSASHAYDYLALIAFAPVIVRARGIATRLAAVSVLTLAQSASFAYAGQALGLIAAGPYGDASFLVAAALLDSVAITVFAVAAALIAAAETAKAPPRSHLLVERSDLLVA